MTDFAAVPGHAEPLGEWLDPWFHVLDPKRKETLLRELQRELGGEHPLHGVAVTVVGKREDRDDILAALEDGRVAEIHLTWSGKGESPPRPRTTLFRSMENWREESMRPSHLDFLND